jgi:ssDNA-binding Zn-finger/Zn-ribbon topoisomerase 1
MVLLKKEWLANTVKKRFEVDLEGKNYKDAIESAYTFKELFPKSRMLKEIIKRCIEEGKAHMIKKRVGLGETFFSVAHQLDKDNKQAKFFIRLIQGYDIGPGGYCPWCGSNRLWGRRGWLWRTCIPCEVTFNQPCPICKSPHLSMTWNETEGEYGCDRCQNVSTLEELKKNKHRPSPFWLMKKATEKKRKKY